MHCTTISAHIAQSLCQYPVAGTVPTDSWEQDVSLLREAGKTHPTGGSCCAYENMSLDPNQKIHKPQNQTTAAHPNPEW